MFKREKCLNGPTRSRLAGFLMGILVSANLVVILWCLVVKIGVLVVIFTALVVKIMDLVVIVK